MQQLAFDQRPVLLTSFSFGALVVFFPVIQCSATHGYGCGGEGLLATLPLGLLLGAGAVFWGVIKALA